jgi:hypothetical protein
MNQQSVNEQIHATYRVPPAALRATARHWMAAGCAGRLYAAEAR